MARQHEERDAAMLAEYEAGILTPALAKKYDISRERVRQILEPTGAIIKKKRARADRLKAIAFERETKREELNLKKARAVELVREGFSQTRAADKLGLSADAVSDAVHAAGVISQYGRWRKQQIAALASQQVAA